ncbi:shikimate kinase [Nocardia cyriacigeorgica]|nr:shikimate kinase [Nocardia cyriacigeorgica]MBF6094122.1 shikimate kinase [Nocardia cyriacigeorgica]
MTSQAEPRAPRVVLVGPPGAGKSTIGRKLARELGVQLYDTDAGIEQETGRSIADIFATDGEAEFRKIEEQVVRRAILDEPGVVSLGGGAVLSENTRALLREHTVVYLEISVAEGLRRTGTSTARPLLNGADPGAKYRELMRHRRPLYREVATVRVRTDGRSPGRVVKMILGKLSLESVRPVAGEGTEQQNRPRTTSPQGSSRSRARRRSRARAAARRAAQAAANGQTGTTDQTATPGTGQSGVAATAQSGAAASTSSTGRSRRARARRARARARTQQERTESEQST